MRFQKLDLVLMICLWPIHPTHNNNILLYYDGLSTNSKFHCPFVILPFMLQSCRENPFTSAVYSEVRWTLGSILDDCFGFLCLTCHILICLHPDTIPTYLKLERSWSYYIFYSLLRWVTILLRFMSNISSIVSFSRSIVFVNCFQVSSEGSPWVFCRNLSNR